MPTDDGWRTLKTLETSFRIIDALQETGGATISELAERLELATSTIHAHVKTLEKHQYVTLEDGVYHVGLRFLSKGGFAANQRTGMEFAEQKVVQLANETGERAQFITEEHGRGIYLATATGDRAVQVDARIGKRIYLHASAAGKAILSQLPRPQVDEIVDRWGLHPLTENTITDRERLADQLRRIEQSGYATNEEESIAGLNAVGVPVCGPDGDVLGALSVSGPSNRMKDERLAHELPELVLGVVNEMELNIAFP